MVGGLAGYNSDYHSDFDIKYNSVGASLLFSKGIWMFSDAELVSATASKGWLDAGLIYILLTCRRTYY